MGENSIDLKTELMQKLYDEQTAYRDYLCTLPAQEILEHAYEINLRDDIQIAVNDMELTDKQMQTLLSLPSPMEGLYKEIEKTEIDRIENIYECIYNRAEKLQMLNDPNCKDIPIYMESPSYALKHEEADQYGASHQANVACCKAIQDAIHDHYRDNRLDTSCAKKIVEQFGLARTQVVLASTIRAIEWDGRISRENKVWAQKIRIPDEIGRDYHVRDCHPGLTDLFCQAVRKMGVREKQQNMSHDAI